VPGTGLRPSGTAWLAAFALTAAAFAVLAWHARRRPPGRAGRAGSDEENGRLLARQRRFLQDVSHQLRTPITIALGHAELLARELAGRPELPDVQVVVGELTRLKRLSERLLVIAATEDPEFQRRAPVALDSLLTDALRRWRPMARRAWQIGPLSAVTVQADREHLGLAVDALLENAVQHTNAGDAITLSVRRGEHPARAELVAELVIEDTGEGIAQADLDSIFDRFRTGSGAGSRGTGLGLALVRAVALGHGGEVLVRSAPGAGSRFKLMLPAVSAPPAVPVAPGARDPMWADDPFGQVRLP